MKARWLNLVLILTNRIYSNKQEVVEQVGIKVIFKIFALFLYEISLGIISLPLYVGLKPQGVVAYLEEKGGYKEIAFDYNLRRVLTLTSASIIFIIWTIKLATILFVPSISGPLQLYQVLNLEPAGLLSQEAVAVETQIQTARVVDTMIRPELSEVKKTKEGNYIFYGTGQPETLVVLFLSGQQTAVLTDNIDEEGQWKVEHSQNDFKLSEGNHAVVAFSYDERLGVRSNVSVQQYFKVKTSTLEKFVKNVDVFINSSIIVVIVLGILLTILTL